MAADIGARVGIEGEGTFRNSLKAINSQLKSLGSEMKSVVAAFTGMENSEEAVAKRGDVLQRSIAASNEKLKLLQNHSEKAKEKLEKLGTNVEKTQQQMEAAAAALEDAKSKFAANSEEVKKAEEEWRKAADSARRAQNAYNNQVSTINQLETQMHQTTAEISRMEREMSQLGESTDELSDDFNEVEGSTRGLESAITAVLAVAAAVGAALAGLGAKAVGVGSEFEASMSQVAATMGLTTAEIRNGSEAYETLAAAAKNAGATTKFTASEAAQALNYLALAGYDAATSADVLPSILNLAAAGGLELANASDLATDAMAALGIEANAANLTRFGDEMAKASSKANYSVAQLGEAILTVGGTAKNLAGGTVELNTALGVLANRGIKGEEGGTALRNMILSLSAPTDKAAKLMDNLGLAVYDAEGNLRPLNETFSDLNAIMADMSGEERTGIISEIFNARDLKSAEALLAGCGEEFNTLAKEIADSGGAMQEMADVQIDNLKGSMTILGSGLEGVGIQVYEKFESPLKKAAKTANDAVGEIARSLKSGRLSQSMDGLAESVGELMENAVGLAKNALPKMIDGLTLLMAHAGEIKTAMLVAAGGVAAFKAANALAPVVKGWQDAVRVMQTYTATTAGARNAELLLASTLSVKEVVVGVLTGKISLLTAAQTAYNAVLAASPLAIAVVGFAAVTAAVVLLSQKENELTKKTRELVSETKNHTESLREREQAWKESAAGALSEMEYAGRLAAELERLTDAEGNVTGSKERVRFLTQELNRIMPDSISFIDGETAAIEGNISALKEQIALKEGEILLESMRQEKLEREQEMAEISARITERKKEILEAERKLAEERARLEREGKNEMEINSNAMVLLWEKELADLQSAKEEEEGIYRSNLDFMQSYNDLSIALETGNVEEMEAIRTRMLSGMKSAGESTDAELKQQIETLRAELEVMEGVARKGSNDVLDAMIGETSARLAEAEAEYYNRTQTLGNALAEGIAAGFNEKRGLIGQTMTNAMNWAISQTRSAIEVNSPSKLTAREIGEPVSEGVAYGIENAAGMVADAAEDMAMGAVSAAEGVEGIVPFARRTAQKVGDVLEKEAKALNGRLAEIQNQAASEQAEAERKQYEESIAEKYKELEKAEKAGKQKLLDEIAKLESDWNKKQEETALKDRIAALQEFQKEYDAAVSEIERNQSSLGDKLAGYGSLFERVKTEEGNELFRLGDIEDEIRKLEEYGDAIERLRGRSISDSLVGEIAGMGVDDALAYMDKLISLSDAKFDQYVSLFEQKQQTAQGVAEKFYQGEFDALEQNYAQRLPEALDGVKAQMYEAGEQAAESLKEGLQADGEGMGQAVTQAVSAAVTGANDVTQEQNFLTITQGMAEQEPVLTEYIESLKEQLIALIESFRGEFTEVGNMMMEGVSQGIRNGESGVVNAVAAVIAAAVARARSDLDINSPSKLAAREIGEPIPEGVAVGIERKAGLVADASEDMAMGAVSAVEGIGGMLPFAQRTAQRVGDVLEKEAKALNGRLEMIQNQAAAVARARSDLDINSLSKVFAEIGVYMAAGLDTGWTEKMQDINRSISNSLAGIASPPRMAESAGAAGGRNYTYGDINLYIDKVNNADGRDVQRMMREMEFFRRQQSAARGG